MRDTLVILILALVIAASGCLAPEVEEEPSSGFKVATTIVPLGEFVKAVGGEFVDVTVVVPPGAEPHTFEPTPSEMAEIRGADLYVKNGAGLETWVGEMISGDVLVIDSSQGLELIGDAGSPDPHVWLSPKNAAIQVENICDGLVAVDPSNEGRYTENRDEYLQELKSLDTQLNRTFSSTKRKSFIALHPAWSYLARDYGLCQIAVEVEDKEPGPRHISGIIDEARAEGIDTVYVEPQFSPKMAELIAREIGGKVVAIDPMAENYVENMRYVGERIADGLGRQGT